MKNLNDLIEFLERPPECVSRTSASYEGVCMAYLNALNAAKALRAYKREMLWLTYRIITLEGFERHIVQGFFDREWKEFGTFKTFEDAEAYIYAR